MVLLHSLVASLKDSTPKVARKAIAAAAGIGKEGRLRGGESTEIFLHSINSNKEKFLTDIQLPSVALVLWKMKEKKL